MLETRGVQRTLKSTLWLLLFFVCFVVFQALRAVDRSWIKTTQLRVLHLYLLLLLVVVVVVVLLLFLLLYVEV